VRVRGSETHFASLPVTESDRVQANRKLAPILKPYRLRVILAPFSAAQAAIDQPRPIVESRPFSPLPPNFPAAAEKAPNQTQDVVLKFLDGIFHFLYIHLTTK